MTPQSVVGSQSRSKKSPCLIQYSGVKLGRRFDLNAAVLLIGSGQNANILIEEPGILPEHARIRCSDGGLVIETIGDAKDIWIDDCLISGSTAIPDGSILRVGNVILKFFDDFRIPGSVSQAFAAYSQANRNFVAASDDQALKAPSAIGTLSLLLVSLGLIAAGFYLAGVDISLAARFTPLMVLLGTTIGLMIAAYPLSVHRVSLRLALTGIVRSQHDLLQASKYFQGLGQMGLVSGFLCFFIAMAVVVGRQSAPGEIGSAVALGILSLAYSFLIRMLSYAKAEHLRETLDTMTFRDETTSVTNEAHKFAA